VYQEFLADMETPVSTYVKIRDAEASYSYLLESADGGRRWGRYSFIGYKPFIVALSRDQGMEVWKNGTREVLQEVKNPMEVLRDLAAQFKPVTLEGLPPFQGGLVGYVNYDLVRKWERLPGLRPENSDAPEAVFTASRRLIVFDHLTHMVKVVVFAHLEEGENLERAYEEALRELEETVIDFRRPLPDASIGSDLSISPLTSNLQRGQFHEMVSRAKDFIVAGDVIQVVLSQKFSGSIAGDDFGLYRNLRSLNPSPYMFYLHFDGLRLIGASPEILIRLTDGKIELRPIAGTRPRGKTADDDRAMEEELMSDPKERAEHIMLVDLGRNDVGKVAEPGSVSVPRLMEVERYSHVMHIVSRVEGTLRRGMNCFDLFMSAFPAGTVSGAPKVRAMEIISELEPSPRGPYAGAVGYFGFNGNMDFCITIRTMSVSDGEISIQVGAGIVADSSPEGEYGETMKKGAAMFKAIERGQSHDSHDR
jgi:anthranilate synthase component 1